MSEETRRDQTGEVTHLWELLHQESYLPEEAAEVLNLPERLILKSAFGGELRARIVNGDVIDISRTDLVAWLKWRASH